MKNNRLFFSLLFCITAVFGALYIRLKEEPTIPCFSQTGENVKASLTLADLADDIGKLFI